jgi:ACS family tartrate transporter-like MFS transporter
MSAQESAVKKASARLVPFLCLLYFIAYLDRVNISFAALQMNADVGISAAAYGLGASMFFIGYLLFEVPSNLVMEKVGARRWLARIMITWGIASIAMVFVVGEKSLYGIRFLLGVAEAGFFPAVIVHLSHWFPRAYRARVIGLFFIAVPLSSVLGAPVSTALLDHTHGFGGLQGWQWMFLLEGLPAVAIGVCCLWYLVDRPVEARWLTAEEARSLQDVLDRERAETEAQRKYHFLEVFTNLRVVVLALVLLLTVSGSYGVGFWMPQIIKLFTASNMTVGWITSGIYLLSVFGMIAFTRYSDATGQRVAPVAAATALGGIGFLICMSQFNSPTLAITGLAIACIGTFSALPVFWTNPSTFLTGTAAAVAVAFINSTAQLSGIAVPWFIGLSKEATGGFEMAIGGLGLSLFLASAAILTFKWLGRTPIGAAAAGRSAEIAR